MIKNFDCVKRNAPSGSVFRLKWEWVPESGAMFSLHVLYRAIFEKEILENSLFDQDTIVLYMLKEIAENNGAAQCMHNTAAGYKTKNYSFNPNSINADIYLEKDIEIKELDCVYFFCMFDNSGNIFRHWVKKAVSESKVEYDVKLKNDFALKKLKFTKQKMLILTNTESRRIILRTGNENEKKYSYSLLPVGCQEYYIDSDMPDFKLIYLSELINI